MTDHDWLAYLVLALLVGVFVGILAANEVD